MEYNKFHILVGSKKLVNCAEGQVSSALTKWISKFMLKAAQRKAKV